MARTPSTPADGARSAGRPRRVEVDLSLREATLALLHEGGPAAVTIEGVAARSGVAKTTIYRRHAHRGELLTAALRDAIGTPEVPHEGSVRDKIRFALGQAWHQMRDVLGPGGLAAIVGDTDPEFTGLFRDALRPYEELLVERIRDDSRAGLLRPDLDSDGIVSLMIGAYVGELVRRGEVDEAWLDRSMELLWVLMAAP